jgi:glycosyltransferase involved in cell wall biosynthesis
MPAASWAVVIPTIGRETLRPLLAALGRGDGVRPDVIVVVNDRPGRPLRFEGLAGPGLRVVPGPGRGPAAARNVGWRETRTDWVVFVDDDVAPDPDWCAAVRRDLDQPADVGGVQGRLTVQLPADRRPTDWERQVAGLATAPWITADMAYRRRLLADIGGFDERFPRAYREDTELAIRVRAAGYRIVTGDRHSQHPVRPAGGWVSLTRQRGNADDALLRRLYGPRWRALGAVPRGRRALHAALTGVGGTALVGLLTGRRRLAAAAGTVWLAGTAEFAARRIAPGPRSLTEIGFLSVTSALIPPLALAHWLHGWFIHRNSTPMKPFRRGVVG